MPNYQELQQLNKDIEQIEKISNTLKDQIAELQFECATEGFWDNLDYAKSRTQKLGDLQVRLNKITTILDNWDFCQLLEDEMHQGDYIDDNDDYINILNNVFYDVQSWKKEQLLNGKYDNLPAILTFHAGSGGTEACDFTDMMLRAITRWADMANLTYQLTDIEKGDVAGTKTATLELKGRDAYGYAKAFNGIFRLVRISPFDAANRRHTSFMAIDVIPLIEDDDTIDINPDDIIFETMTAHVKAGGQNMQHNNMAVRITHKPSGIVIRYDAERSQLQNRNCAMAMLKAKLLAIKQQEREDEINGIKGEKIDNGWGNAICSIVLMPYQLVKDNRTNWESSNTNAFLDGELSGFISAYLEWNHEQ